MDLAGSIFVLHIILYFSFSPLRLLIFDSLFYQSGTCPTCRRDLKPEAENADDNEENQEAGARDASDSHVDERSQSTAVFELPPAPDFDWWVA